MSIDLTLRLIEAVNATPAGSSVVVAIDSADDVALVERWTDATGNTILTVLPDGVEIVRGRIADPLMALPEDRRPGYRLWLYSNFNCNLACDYCCVASSPRAAPREFTVDDTAALVREAAAAGVQEFFVTGGEPFMLLDLDERLRLALDHFPTTVLTNGMVWQGERGRRLEALPRDGLTLQISLDSATPELHDRHRGAGSFGRAHDGIRRARDLGFRVRVAATLGADADDAEAGLAALFDEFDLPDEDRVVRRIARQGAANAGLTVSRSSLVPEVCVSADGVWWHPVAATDPAMRVSSAWSPLADTIAAISDEYREHRIRGDVLASTFPCA